MPEDKNRNTFAEAARRAAELRKRPRENPGSDGFALRRTVNQPEPSSDVRSAPTIGEWVGQLGLKSRSAPFNRSELRQISAILELLLDNELGAPYHAPATRALFRKVAFGEEMNPDKVTIIATTEYVGLLTRGLDITEKENVAALDLPSMDRFDVLDGNIVYVRETYFAISFENMAIVATRQFGDDKAYRLVDADISEKSKDRNRKDSISEDFSDASASTIAEQLSAVTNPSQSGAVLTSESLNFIAAVLSQAIQDLDMAPDQEIDFTKPLGLTTSGDKAFVSIPIKGTSRPRLTDISTMTPSAQREYALSKSLAKIGERTFKFTIDGKAIFAFDLDEAKSNKSPGKQLASALNRAYPELARWNDANRPTQPVVLRLDPALIEEMDRAAIKRGMTRADLVRAAIASFIKPKP